MISEVELVDNVRKGMASAFDKLFALYCHKLYSFAFSILKSKEDAEDVVQLTFFKVWEKRESLNKGLVFKSFIFTIAYNITIDMLRERLREKGCREQISRRITENYNLDDSIVYGDLLKRIDKITQGLPARKKSIFQLSRNKYFSHTEIAGKLNISVKTVENGIGHSLKYIRKHLGDDLLILMLLSSLIL